MRPKNHALRRSHICPGAASSRLKNAKTALVEGKTCLPSGDPVPDIAETFPIVATLGDRANFTALQPFPPQLNYCWWSVHTESTKKRRETKALVGISLSLSLRQRVIAWHQQQPPHHGGARKASEGPFALPPNGMTLMINKITRPYVVLSPPHGFATLAQPAIAPISPLAEEIAVVVPVLRLGL